MKIKLLSVIWFLSVLTFWSANCLSQSRHLFPVSKNNAFAEDCCRMGFIDENGKLKIDFKYYYATEFQEGLSLVQINKKGKWGYADENGLISIETQFDEAMSFSEGLAEVKKNGETYYIDRSGKKVLNVPSSMMILGFSKDISPARLLESAKWGFVNSQGKVIIPFKFQYANAFHEDLSAVIQGNRLGYIDRLGKWVIPPRFSPMTGFTDPIFLPNFSEGLAVYRDKDKFGYINRSGHKVILASFDRAESFSEGLAQVQLNGKVGYLDRNGSYAIEPQFSNGGEFSNGFAPVRIGGQIGYVDMEGILQIQPKYDSAAPFRNGLARVSKYDAAERRTTIGYINKRGEMIYSWYQ